MTETTLTTQVAEMTYTQPEFRRVSKRGHHSLSLEFFVSWHSRDRDPGRSRPPADGRVAEDITDYDAISVERVVRAALATALPGVTFEPVYGRASGRFYWHLRAERKADAPDEYGVVGLVYESLEAGGHSPGPRRSGLAVGWRSELSVVLVNALLDAQRRIAAQHRAVKLVKVANNVGAHTASAAVERAHKRTDFKARMAALREELRAAVRAECVEAFRELPTKYETGEPIDQQALALVTGCTEDFAELAASNAGGGHGFGGKGLDETIGRDEQTLGLLAAAILGNARLS